MNVIDKLITEWSWRCEKGYPDLSNPKDVRALGVVLNEFNLTLSEDTDLDSKIIDLVKQNKDNTKLLNRVYRTLQSSPFVGRLKEILANANINKETFDNRNLPQEIISILQRGETSNVEEFINVITDLKVPKSGNIYSEYPGDLQPKIKAIGSLTGASNVVSMGKGELLFPLTYSDLKILPNMAGDLSHSGKAVELKAIGVTKGGEKTSGGRLGIGRKATKYEPVTEVPKDISSLPSILHTDYTQAKENKNEEEALTNIKKFLGAAFYGDSNIQPSITAKNLDSSENIINMLYTFLIRGYVDQKSIDEFLLFDPISGKFEFLSVDELINKLHSRAIKTTTFNRSTTIVQLTDF